MRKELAEIYCKDMGDGTCEKRLQGAPYDITALAIGLLQNVAELNAQQLGVPKWVALMAMADTIRDFAEEAKNEDGRLS